MNKRACVFVDGENFRYSIGHLFACFDQSKYLPKGRWEKFFDWLVQKACDSPTTRLRTYWYAIEYIDFFPSFFSDLEKNTQKLRQFYIKSNQEYKTELENLSNIDLIAKLTKITHTLQERKILMQKRFDGWQVIHNAIAVNHRSIEFRREGGIRYDLFKQKFGKEKAVDVKLAVDLLELRSIYDLAIIVSGDQDYVPAVKVLKDSGKQVVNISFQRRDGQIVPGGANGGHASTASHRKIRHIGITGHNSDLLQKAIEQSHQLETILFPFNIIENGRNEQALLKVAKELEVGIIIMKPLAGGVIPEPELSLRWILQQGVDTVIPRMILSQEVKLNAITGDKPCPLSSQELSHLKNAVKKLEKEFCRRCMYCMPCPEGVPIYVIQEMGDKVKVEPVKIVYQEMYVNLEKTVEDCIECGECEKKCPYQLPVRKMLKEKHRLLTSS